MSRGSLRTYCRQLVRTVVPFACTLLVVWLLVAPLPAGAELPPEQRSRVLILNSYHPFYTWSDHEMEGILESMRQRLPRFEPMLEYLDTKFFPEGDHFSYERDLLRHKFRNIRIPLVIAADNPALQFALNYRQELFPNVPIVFCGIDGYSPSLLQGQRNVTGVAQLLDTRGTVETMLKLHPGTKEIFVIHDYTPTGLATRRETQTQLAELGDRIRIRYMADLTTDQMLAELKVLPKDALVLALSYSRDREGRVFDHTQIAKLLSDASPVPVYGTHQERLGFGIVGGSLLSGKLHGARAGELALKVLGGQAADSLPVETRSSARFKFDYRQLERYGIPLDLLPAGSTVINRPVSFYAEYRRLVWSGIGLLVTLLAVILTLVHISSIRKRAAMVLEQRVAERTAQLQTANRELESFCYSVSHDLRAPLRHVSGYNQIVLDEHSQALPPEARDCLERVGAACRQLGQLIDDLLELSRVYRCEMQHEPVSLSKLAREIANDLQQSAPDRRVIFTIGDRLHVVGDPRLLRVALENLLGNAWKYTSKKASPSIEFGARQEEKQLVFFVRDNGAGFDMTYANKLFQPFQRLHGAEFEGTGIGLATVQRIIERHRGRVWGESKIGTGATIFFTIGTEV
ncbi:MAG TPA: ATP-binding protein [Geobacteraceae bacterium]